MKRKCTWFVNGIIIMNSIFFSMMIPISIFSENVSGEPETITVDDDGGKDYECIQDAVDAAQGGDGDIIEVYAGTYIETVTVDEDYLTIRAEESDVYVKPPDIHSNCIVVEAANVLIQGLQLRGPSFESPSDNPGILVQGEGNDDCTIKWCEIYYFDIGIRVNSVSNTVLDANTIENYQSEGIYINSASGTKIDYCWTDNGDYIGTYTTSKGIKVYNSNHVLIQNTDSRYNFDGIELNTASISLDAQGEAIYNNLISCNTRYGIQCIGSTSLDFKNNGISDNDEYGLYFDNTCASNTIWKNNFIDNNADHPSRTSQAKDSSSACDFDDNTSEGNYWDDWSSNPGYASTYDVFGGGSQDEYPASSPYGMT